MTRLYSSISTETTLNAGINTTQTTMQVPSTAAATALLGGVTLAAGNVDIFTVVIDPDTVNEEIVFVTAVSGDTFTVSRGQAGTGTAGVSGIAHSAGATIRHVLTSSDLIYFRNGVVTADAAVPNSTLTAKGSILTATAASTPSGLAVGTNGQYLKADSTTATGLAWSTLPPSGKILQVVQATYASSVSNSTANLTDTGLTATITPSSASSKVLIMYYHNWDKTVNNALNAVYIELQRGSTALCNSSILGYSNTTALALFGSHHQSFLDSPATTSAVTYKTQMRNILAAVAANTSNGIMILMEVGA